MKGRTIAWKIGVITAGIVFLSSCETLRSLLSLEQPEVRVVGASLTDLSFEGAQITAELELENPNEIGISLRGVTYELFIEGERFVNGDISEPIEIAPRATATLNVPVAFEFLELVATMERLREQNEAAYTLSLDVRFELPILGEVTVPVATEGSFPVLRRPTVRLSALVLESIGLTGAELELTLTVENPNTVGLRVESLSYEFQVEGETWVDGSTPRPQSVAPRADSMIVIPFTVRFLSVGRAARTILLGTEAINYRLELSAQIDTNLDLVPTIALPLVLEGSVPLDR